MLSFASFVVFHPRASILHLLLPFTRPRRAFTCVSCKEFKAKPKRLSSDYFALLNNRGFSYAPSPFRSVGTQKEKPSQTGAVVFDGFLCSMPYGLYSKVVCLMITSAQSYHLTLQRYEYYLNHQIFFKVFFEVVLIYPINRV